MTRSIDLDKPAIGSIGVMLDDASPTPTLWEFVGMFSSFIGRYRSLIDGRECHRDIDQFWAILDSLPWSSPSKNARRTPPGFFESGCEVSANYGKPASSTCQQARHYGPPA